VPDEGEAPKSVSSADPAKMIGTVTIAFQGIADKMIYLGVGTLRGARDGGALRHIGGLKLILAGLAPDFMEQHVHVHLLDRLHVQA
jgi:hypothetical protein